MLTIWKEERKKRAAHKKIDFFKKKDNVTLLINVIKISNIAADFSYSSQTQISHTFRQCNSMTLSFAIKICITLLHSQRAS